MPWWIGWLVAGAVLGVLELLTLTFALGILAVAAVLAGVAGAAGLGLALQTIIFAVIAVGGLLAGRPLARRHLRIPPKLRTGTRALVGRPAKVVERVTDEDGRVRIGGEVWSARSYDGEAVIEVGATVDVFEIEGATALVHPRSDPWNWH